MYFKSVFGSVEKGINPEDLPKPPTIREMIEDIENCSKEDPVMKFANELEKKGNGSGIGSYDDNTTFEYDSSFSDWLIESLAVGSCTKKAQLTPKSPASPSTSKDSPAPSSESEDLHGKLKQISSICLKSEDIVSKVEARLKELESVCQEILQRPTDTDHDQDSDEVKLT